MPSMVEIPVWMNSSGECAGVGVDGSTGDVQALLGNDLRAAIDGLAATGEDPPEHLPSHGHLDGLAGEPDAAVPADTGGGLEDLDHDQFVARVEDLPPLDGAVGEDDVHEFPIPNRLGLLDKDEGPGNLGDRPVFLHAIPPSVH